MRLTRRVQDIVDEYRGFLEPTGSGDSTEDLLVDETPWQTNAIRAIIAASKKGEVLLLLKLQRAGLLGSAAKAGEGEDATV